MSITLDQVTKRYQGSPVVNDVSLEVGEGEFFVLLGPSGSGKSTLLRAIAGLTGVDHGRIALHGNDVTHVSARQRGVGFVFQNYALFRHMTVGENIEFALRVRRMRADGPAAASQGAAAPGRARRHGRSSADAALRRPAAARRGRARAGAQARSAAARRAVRRARREDPRRAASHDPPGAARAEDHHRAGHARPGRSVRARRSHRRDESRPPARDAAGPTSCTTRPATRFVATFLGAANLLLARQTEQGIRFGATPVNARRIEKLEGGREHEVVAVLRPEEDRAGADARQPAHQLHRDRRRRRAGVHRCAGAHSRAHDQRRRPMRTSAATRMPTVTAPLPCSTSRALSTSSARSRWCSVSRSRSACDAFTCCRRRCRATRRVQPSPRPSERLVAASVPGRARGPHEDAHRQAHRTGARDVPGQRADAHLRRRRDRRARESRASRSSGCCGTAPPK